MYIAASGMGCRCARIGGTSGEAVLALGLRDDTLRHMASHLRTGRADWSTIFANHGKVGAFFVVYGFVGF